MANNTKKDLYKMISEIDDQCVDNQAIGGPSLLSYGQYNDSARMIMFNNHVRQFVTLGRTEFPKVFTNMENVVGEYSSYNKRADANYTVINIIDKFSRITTLGEDAENKYYFVKNEDTGMIDVKTRKDVEDLTEKYGFKYNNEGINRFKVGDRISVGQVLTRPTTFDKYDNYGYGRNVPTMYISDVDTIEDAIQISESFAKEFTSYEIEEVKVTLNDNDFLVNLYGDDYYYKSFPDIGENIKDRTLLAIRRIIKSQILFDFKQSNASKILPSDRPKIIDGTVVDVRVYRNKPLEDIPNTIFNRQLLDYLEMDKEFHTKMYEYTDELIREYGENKCSAKIHALHKDSSKLINDNFVVKDETNSQFSYVTMYFLIKREVGVTRGQKLSGRSGNKGVVASITPDNEMPWVVQADGTPKRIDVKVNCLAPFNRLITFQLYEQSITFITNRMVERFKCMDLDNKDDFKYVHDTFFKVLNIFNPEQHDKFKKIYKEQCTTKKTKKEFFEVVMENGIMIHIKPFWHMKNLYDCVVECYNTFDWLEPYDTYFFEPVSKRWVKMMNKQYIGDMYMIKLKQTSKKGLSACSTAPINKKGLPEKTDSAKKHDTVIARTPIKSGIQETFNDLISQKPETVAKEHLLYRSSPVGRVKLGTELIESYGEGKPIEVELTDKMTNRNVEILSAYSLIMGFGLIEQYDDIHLPDGSEDDNVMYTHKYKGETIVATPTEMRRIVAKDIASRRIESGQEIIVGERAMDKELFIDQLADIIEADMMDSDDYNDFDI